MQIKGQNNRAFSHKLGLIALPALLWVLLFFLRPYFYTSWCAVTPTPCLQDQVNALDQWAFAYGSIRADYWSNVVQNTIGLIAFTLPFLIYSKNERRHSWLEAWRLARVSLWNGVLLEVVRALVQRPRPVVFHDPMLDGANIHQYSSFYSGHTSFVAIATLGMYFMVRRRFPQQAWIHFNFLIVFISVTLLTGVLRVVGGRHYPSDVLAGCLIGSALILFFNRRYPTPS